MSRTQLRFEGLRRQAGLKRVLGILLIGAGLAGLDWLYIWDKAGEFPTKFVVLIRFFRAEAGSNLKPRNIELVQRLIYL